ncbi:MAG: hypothetical protein M3463_03105 [Verrucomicrobiota bacterium]|nr:hypothetical protein [Verrucomicrobiota bacterium]
MNEAMSWLGTLGFPNLARCDFVRIQLPGGEVGGDRKYYTYGFLLKSEKDHVEVFTTGLADVFPDDLLNFLAEPLRIQRTRLGPPGPGPSEHSGQAYEILDLQTTGRAILDSKLQCLEYPSRCYFNPRIALFLFAWGCRENGLEDLSRKLVSKARLLRWLYFEAENYQAEPWIKILQNEIPQVLVKNTASRFASKANSWEKLSSELQDILQRYPHFPDRQNFEEMVSELRIMIVERNRHVAAPLDQLSTGEQVSELIYQLREQTFTSFHSGRYGPFPANANSPQKILRRMGKAVLPYLHEALEDRRLTRMVTAYSPKLRVMRVRDAVKMIADEIVRDQTR